ncbi:DEAD/DEAH box helicase family protein [Micromonospora sp. NPDC005979]|uniref:DEAD/DEAH box helicase n=1 Tax=Micromonospora sp. NPDC005979 TaxID=3156726 RepID=UPI0033A490DB
MTTLRTWQQEALRVISNGSKPDHLITATPGAGKTTFALALAARLLEEGSVRRVAVVVPTDSLREQWADAAGRLGLNLMPVSAPEDYEKPGYRGCVVTYAQLATGAGRELLRRTTRVPTLAVLDEIHHAGESRSWGDGLRYAVENAVMRVALTGTPWRRDNQSPIPFVMYDSDGQVLVDYAYEYGTAVADGVCRRIEFHAYDGEARWIDCGVVGQASLGAQLRDEDVSTVLDGVFHPEHAWMPVLLRQADDALTEIRQEIPDAGGLVVAERQWHAQQYAALLREISGTEPTVVVSDDPTAKEAIDRFRRSTSRWIIAVKMVSEGVDIPRLAVGVYASKTRTPLFFRQVVGRFVRTRPSEEFNARLYIPAVPALMEHALQIEQELRHQLDVETGGDGPDGERGSTHEQPLLPTRELVSATEAAFDRAILAGEEVSPTDLVAAQATARQLGIPTQYALNLLPLMRQQAPEAAPVHPPATEVVTPRHRQERMLRAEVETLARKYAFKAKLEPRQVNTELRRAGFPPRAKASISELRGMLNMLARWHGGQ